jgi:NAD(P)-dependent dehydrogenase (short-subunit alcohol dehydrogenase family)
MNMIRTALITGAARRIGKRMAMDLAAQGWAVAIHYNSSREEAQAVASEIAAAGGRAAIVQGDLSSPAAPQKIIKDAVEALGP